MTSKSNLDLFPLFQELNHLINRMGFSENNVSLLDQASQKTRQMQDEARYIPIRMKLDEFLCAIDKLRFSSSTDNIQTLKDNVNAFASQVLSMSTEELNHRETLPAGSVFPIGKETTKSESSTPSAIALPTARQKITELPYYHTVLSDIMRAKAIVDGIGEGAFMLIPGVDFRHYFVETVGDFSFIDNRLEEELPALVLVLRPLGLPKALAMPIYRKVIDDRQVYVVKDGKGKHEYASVQDFIEELGKGKQIYKNIELRISTPVLKDQLDERQTRPQQLPVFVHSDPASMELKNSKDKCLPTLEQEANADCVEVSNPGSDGVNELPYYHSALSKIMRAIAIVDGIGEGAFMLIPGVDFRHYFEETVQDFSFIDNRLEKELPVLVLVLCPLGLPRALAMPIYKKVIDERQVYVVKDGKGQHEYASVLDFIQELRKGKKIYKDIELRISTPVLKDQKDRR